jgi:phage gp29-like protein
LVLPRPEDVWQDYPSSGLTPSRLMAILREADMGSLSATMQLFAEMEEKDPHLYAVANTRRLALTGLEWQVVSAGDLGPTANRALADEAAVYAREVLAEMESFDEALQHLSLAIGRNIAVAELVWETVGGELRLVDLCPVDFTRLAFDELGSLRILTKQEPIDGMALVPNKFVVHAPHNVGGHLSRGGLLRVTAMVYLAKNLALKDWMIFAEVFGMPVRIARYEPSATEQEKRELLEMLESLGSNAAGVFSRAVELQIVEANRGTVGPPYEKLVDFLNREMSKAWLGQTLTTETTGVSGTLTVSEVHDEVRKDIRTDDVRKEGRTLRRDVLGPLCRLKFGPDAPVPYFRRKPGRAKELQELTRVLDAAVNRLGVGVPLSWAHEALGIPQAGQGEAVVSGVNGRSQSDRRGGDRAP